MGRMEGLCARVSVYVYVSYVCVYGRLFLALYVPERLVLFLFFLHSKHMCTLQLNAFASICV